MARDHHAARSGFPRRHQRRQPPDPGPQHRDDITWPDAADRRRPADPGPERIEEGGDDRIERIRHAMEHRVRREVLVGGVTAPQPRCLLGRDEPVHVAQPVIGALVVLTAQAGGAFAAGLEHLDRDTVARGHTPPG